MSIVLPVQDLALRSHDISVGLGNKIVPEFESLPQVGQMVRLALHVRGLPRIEYDILRLIASHYLQISPSDLRNIVRDLAEVEFIRIFSEGGTYKAILPTVPYYDEMYTMIGDYATKEKNLNEAEQLALTILDKLTQTPVSQTTPLLLDLLGMLQSYSMNPIC